MYLKELNLFGFKSFPEKTSLKFDSGITAVVGPNGCGKSNVFDSIKWALGEQSPKSLRGAKMEDVIFNGTENYPALNYAEVSLTFSNEDKYLPINYNEVLISRRLYRSGESQYFINKSPVRLKDVQNLFLGTGIGESTYSFIEQGKIEALLSYKPEDKRLIFDEASGIVKYKERKKEALRRLAEADDNIVRLDDILTEVNRQIKYLERQAEKAEKYKDTKKELIDTEKNIAAKKREEFDIKINELSLSLASLTKSENEVSRQLSLLGAGLDQIIKEQDSFKSELERINTLVISAQAQINTDENNIDFSQQRIREIQERDKQLILSKQGLEEKLSIQKQRKNKEEESFQETEEANKNLEKELENLFLEKEQTEQKVKQAQKDLKQKKEGILNLEDHKAKIHNSIIELQTQISTLLSRKKRLILDKGKLDNLLSENLEKFKDSESNCSEISAKLNQLKEKKQRLASEERQFIQRIEEAKAMLSQQEKEFFELQASFQFLKEFRTKYETFSREESVTVIFNKNPGDINKLVASLKNTEFVQEGSVFKAEVQAKVIAFEQEQLQQKITDSQAKIEQLKQEIQNMETKKHSLDSQLSSEDSYIENYKNSLNQANQNKESAQRELKRLREECELVEEETKNTLSELVSLESEKEKAKKEFDEKAEELGEVNQSLFSLQQLISDSEEALKEADIKIAQTRAQKESFFKEKESINSRLDIFREEIESINKNIEQVDQEKSSNQKQCCLLEEKIKQLKEKIEKDNQKIKESVERKKELQEKEGGLSQKALNQRQSSDKLKEKLSGVKQEIYDQKLKVQSFEYEKEKIKDYLQQVYNLDVDLASLNLPDGSQEELSKSKEKLKKRLDSLGEVNLVAIDEFQELKERRDFLENQRTDLITSKDNLKKAINKINRTSRQIFIETFEKIEKEFRKNYKFLFNGGRAKLILIDPNNILDSGVEIEVQPPGKKLQNVSLLSGGEKALTAIALIFSIFTVNPSPLSVLDEIDAPLDEANVDRFNHMLKDFSRNAQFILITHNKKTMSNVDVLYGVTMQQKGVSKLVSVKFAQEQAPS